MSSLHDWFVGTAAMVVGCLLLLGAILDLASLMALSKVRLLVETVGKPTARWLLALLGTALVAMGALIATGWRMPW